MPRAHNHRDHHGDDDARPEDDEEEVTGESEASRTAPPKGRAWPWIIGATALPVGAVVMWSAFGPTTIPQPKAASIVVVPPPAFQSVQLTGAAAPPPPPPPSTPSTPPPGNVRPTVVTREASTLSDTSRAAKIRADEKAEADRRRARETEGRETAVQPAAASRGGERERPGVNQQRPWVNEHPEMTIPSHTPIACNPDGPINSAGIGPVTCTIAEPVRSEDGTNILLWQGAVVEGYLGQGLQNGERRLMLTFDRIRTTDYVRIPLRGIGASALGENGITGTYDSHLWERIQSGVILTVIEGAVNAGVGAASSAASGGANGGGGQFFNFGSVSSRASSTLGQSALAQDYNRPSTLRRGEADTIVVKTMGDIDLSSVYELQEVRVAAAAAGAPPVRRRAR